MSIWRGIGIAAAAGVLAAGCTDSLLVTPAKPAPVTFSLSLAPSAAVMGGATDAFAKTDAARVQLTSAGAAVLDTSVAISGSGNRSVALRVNLAQSPMQLAIGVNLSAAGKTLFTGTGSAQMQRGHTTEAVIQLSPVVAGLVLPDSLPTITALGDTTHARGAAVFASGDTVPNINLTWSDGSSPVVRAQPDGSLRSLSEGVATLTATYGGFTGTTRVRVHAIVVNVGFTVGVDTLTLQYGSQTQLVAVPRDRNGNKLVRSPTWQSSNPAVVTVDGNGNVRAVGSGTTTISAIIEGKAGTITITVPPLRIVVKPADTTLLVGDTTVLMVGDTATFIATAYSQGNVLPGLIFGWSSTSPFTVTVDPSRGFAQAFAAGWSNVSARVGADSGSALVCVNAPPTTSASATLTPQVAGGACPNLPAIGLATNEAGFNLPAGTLGGPQVISVINTGSGTLCGLTAVVQYPVLDPTGWLSATLSSDCAPSTLSLVANSGNLPPGTYTATVVVSSTRRHVVTQTVTVTLTVPQPAGSGKTGPCVACGTHSTPVAGASSTQTPGGPGTGSP